MTLPFASRTYLPDLVIVDAAIPVSSYTRMTGSLLTNIVGIAGVTAIVAGGASDAGMDGVRLPANLSADAPALTSLFRQMWQSSRTFRRQCQRLAAAGELRVMVFLNVRQPPPAPAQAWTTLEHRHGQLVSARVYVRRSADTVQAVAHEIEHIIEQLDGVDLPAQAGSDHVWHTADQAFETRRAVAAGRRVAWEFKNASRADAHDASHGVGATGGAGGLQTIVRNDRRGRENDASSYQVSSAGRHVVFTSFAQLVASDLNRLRDVYVLDLRTGNMSLESAAVDGASADGDSNMPGISGDGRFVVFESVAGNLVQRPMPAGIPRVFLRDRTSNTTRLLSATPTGEPLNAPSWNPAISADGTAVIFQSAAPNILAASDPDSDASGRLYLIRPSTTTRMRVDVSNDRSGATSQTAGASISSEGRFVAFMSRNDLSCKRAAACAGEIPDRNGLADIYLRDTETRVTRRISRSHSGGDPDGASYQPAISGDGRYIVFVSEASNLVRGMRKGAAQVYLHDTASGTTTLVSHTPRGQPARGASRHPAISRDGGVVAFQSAASDLVCDAECPVGEEDSNLLSDVFLYDVTARRTTRASASPEAVWTEYSRAPTVDDNGCVVAFASRHPVDDRDEAHDEELYVWLRCG
jgi:Tol biopolymer transport system component